MTCIIFILGAYKCLKRSSVDDIGEVVCNTHNVRSFLKDASVNGGIWRFLILSGTAASPLYFCILSLTAVEDMIKYFSRRCFINLLFYLS